MGPFAIGGVVVLAFPYSDLSYQKIRPALMLANAERGDWVLCQITSQAFGDKRAISIQDSDFQDGSLLRQSYARPLKLFTAHESTFKSVVGNLLPTKLQEVIDGLKQALDSR
jgi:mRNA interferase MazF